MFLVLLAGERRFRALETAMADDYPDSFSVTLTVFIAVQFMLGLISNVGIQISSSTRQVIRVRRGNFFVRTLGWIDTVLCLTLMPLTFAVIIIFPNVNIVLCALHESVISMAISATATCVLFISLDRYGAIVTPTVHRITHNNVRFFNLLILGVSLLGFFFPIMSLCFVTSSDTPTYSTRTSVMFCRELLLSFSSVYIYEVYSLGLALISTITTAVCYVKIFKIAKRRIDHARKITCVIMPSNSGPKSSSKPQERRTLWLTLAIVCSFFLTWGPFIVVAILQTGLQISLQMEMTRLCLLSLGMSSTVLHPIFYTFVKNRANKHKHLRKIMIEASRDQAREFQQQQHILKGKSTVQNLVLQSASHGISLCMSNIHDLEIFTTCRAHPTLLPMLRGQEHIESDQWALSRNSETSLAVLGQSDAQISGANDIPSPKHEENDMYLKVPIRHRDHGRRNTMPTDRSQVDAKMIQALNSTDLYSSDELEGYPHPLCQFLALDPVSCTFLAERRSRQRSLPDCGVSKKRESKRRKCKPNDNNMRMFATAKSNEGNEQQNNANQDRQCYTNDAFEN